MTGRNKIASSGRFGAPDSMMRRTEKPHAAADKVVEHQQRQASERDPEPKQEGPQIEPENCAGEKNNPAAVSANPAIPAAAEVAAIEKIGYFCFSDSSRRRSSGGTSPIVADWLN